jgi:uncharacterized membrane protein
MTDLLAIALGTVSFGAPGAAWWFYVLRRRTDDVFESLVCIGALSAFLVPACVFVLNRLFAYPLSREGTVAVAVVLVALAFVWPRFVAPRLAEIRRLFTDRLHIGGTRSSTEQDARRPPR